MARLPTRGAIVATPYRTKTELGACLADLGVGHSFDDEGMEQLYMKIGEIVGQWMAVEGRIKTSPVAERLLSTSKHLDEIVRILTGHETGLHDSVDIEIVSQLAEYLALDPTVRSITAARALISAFHREAARIAHSSLVAAVDLTARSGKHGRPRLNWYDEFTALLLEIAQKTGVEPSSRKDRTTGERSGWLLNAALALETFLYPHMRSPSTEARGQRLDRSRRRLRQRVRQKSTAG